MQKNFKARKKQAKRMEGQFPFFGKRGKGNGKYKKSASQKCSREKT